MCTLTKGRRKARASAWAAELPVLVARTACLLVVRSDIMKREDFKPRSGLREKGMHEHGPRCYAILNLMKRLVNNNMDTVALLRKARHLQLQISYAAASNSTAQ
jgi:hypothetical protein